MNFHDFHFTEKTNHALETLAFHEPTPVQAQVIPLVQQGASVVAQSQTGSGKSHAFLLPLLDQLKDEARTQVVIAAPSRELAEQLYQAARAIVADFPFVVHIERAYGGIDSQKQQSHLETTTPQLVIGTPGRLEALADALDYYHVDTFVIDEADMTLDLGFLPTVDRVAGAMPDDLQMLVFSATIPDKLRPFLTKYMAHPEWVTIEHPGVIAPTIQNILVPLKGRDRLQLLTSIATHAQPYLALIFANTRETVDTIADHLKAQGLSVAKLHGGLSARERKRTMRQIKQLDYQYVVATDLASRGIDIEGVSDVVNYELPTEIEFFIHRVGRTGRNGQSGRAITLYHPDEYDQIEWLTEQGMTFEPYDFKNGTWRKAPAPDRRKRHSKQPKNDAVIRSMIAKHKKQRVKPGYKKKLNRDIENYKKRQKRRRK